MNIVPTRKKIKTKQNFTLQKIKKNSKPLSLRPAPSKKIFQIQKIVNDSIESKVEVAKIPAETSVEIFPVKDLKS